MNAAWGWDPEVIKKYFEGPKIKYKYVITDDKDEFLASMNRIAEKHFAETKDNLRYLEHLDRIKAIEEGAELRDVFTWLKDFDDK